MDMKEKPASLPGSGKRKTDRRTLYTINVVKDAFLELVNQMPFNKISVTAVCRQAEVTRATFYLHFDNITEVLDAVIDDAFLFSGIEGNTVVDLMDIVEKNGIDAIKENETVLPACQRIADSDRYHRLFTDPGLSDYIIGRLYIHEKDKVVPSIMKRTGLSRDEAEILFRFILNGSFYVNRTLGWEKNDKWYKFQYMLNRFMDGGFNNISRNHSDR